jgi:predicted P-loop ATPase
MFRDLNEKNISFYNLVTSKSKNKDISILEFIEIIRNGSYQSIIDQIRDSTEAERKKIKSTLPAVTLSGSFQNSHKEDELIKHSGFIQIDIDHIEEIKAYKDLLYNDPYTFCGFDSPTGTGLKLIVKIPLEKDQHKIFFFELEKYYKKQYQIKIDPVCKDVCRLCFVSFDENLFLNEKSELFQDKPEKKLELIQETLTNPILKDDHDYFYNSSNFDFFVSEIEKQKMVLVNNYEEWRNLAFAISNEFGLKGFDYFDRISSLCPKYEKHKIKDQYYKFHKDNNGTIEIKTVFAMAKRSGLKNSNNEKKNSVELIKRNIPKVVLIKNYISANYDIRHNTVACSYQWKKIDENNYIDFNENDLFLELLENHYQVALPLIKSLVQSSWIKQFNPFEEYLENLPKWDGKTDHISQLLSFLKLDETTNFNPNYHFKKWMVRIVKCMVDPNYFNKQMIVLVQEKQNGGKSTFCRFLCPEDLKNYYTESIVKGKDEDIQLATNFLICYDELSKLSKGDIQQIKALMSALHVNVRLPFGARQTLLNRRCSFIGNTNTLEFLNDETGSIRFICFHLLDKIDFTYREKVDINLVYSQAYSLLKSGSFTYDLTDEDSKNIQNYNQRFQVLTPERELLEQNFEPCFENDPNGQYLTNTEILTILQNKNTQIKLRFRDLGKALTLLEFKRVNKRLENGKYPQYVYQLKTKNE